MAFALRDGVVGSIDDPLPKLLEALDRRGVGGLVVLDRQATLAGLLLDSRVRSGLASAPGAALPTLSEVLDRDPPTASEDAGLSEISELLQKRTSRYAVALDRFGRPSGLFAPHAISGAGSLSEAVIMAGGLGSRLRPFTDAVPKPLLMVGDAPILEIIIKHLVRFGIKRVFLSVNYFSEKIKEYFQDGRNHGVEISYLEEREALGTAGSLRLLPRLERPFLVMNGDLLTGLNLNTLSDVHAQQNAALTVGMVSHKVQIPYGVIHCEAMKLIEIQEKPTTTTWINAGIYVLSPGVLDQLPAQGSLDMPSLIEQLIAGGQRVAGFPMRESWLDIGQLQNYQRAVQNAVSQGPRGGETP